MPQIVIPPQDTKQWTKPSRGELFGSLWSTKNIDLQSNKGKVRLSERTYRVFDSGDDADFEIPVKFIRTDADKTDRWWALVQASKSSVSDGLLFKTTNTNPLVGWTQDAIADTPTDCVDDMEIFGQANNYDRLIVSRDTDLAMMNNETWTASWWVSTLSQAALTAANPHPLHQFINLLLVIDGNVVHTIDDSLVVVINRIKLPKEYQIIWVADDGSMVYFGTRHKRGGEALVFPWNGTDETYSSPIPVNDWISLAGVAKDGIMYTLNGKGQLMGYNGVAFEEVAALPVVEKNVKWWNTTARREMVHPNGMTLIESEIHILLRNQVGSLGTKLNYNEEFKSGIWTFDKDIGLYHKYSLGQYDDVTNNDWGASLLSDVGALVETDLAKGRFLAGLGVFSDNASTVIRSIIASKTILSRNNRGYIVTSQISAVNIRNFWKRLQITFKKFFGSTDRIVVKYRTDKNRNFIHESGVPFTVDITWVSTTQFTSTVTTFANVGVDDEMEIAVGKGAGALVHVSSISYSAPTYTINIDEAIPNVSGDAMVLIQNWRKLGTISSQTVQKELFKIAKRSKWIQLKIELRAWERSPELEELLLEFEPSKR